MSETGENRIGLASFVWLRSPAVSRHAGKVTMQEIEKYLKGDDVYCTVLAYVVRGGGMTTAREVPNVFGASRALPFELCDEAWPTSIDMTEFRIGSAPADFDERLVGALESVQREGPTLCWFMFDGAFDAGSIGSEWHRWNCYAVHAPSLSQPMLALSEADRRSEKWARIWTPLGVQLYAEYPGLRIVEGE